MHGLSVRLCSVPFPTLPKRAQRLGCFSAQTSCTPATPLYAGVEPTHTRICSATSCDVFARVVSIKPCGRDRVYFFVLPTSRTHLPRNNPCDSVAYAEGVQKRKAFLFLSFSYFSDRRKVPFTYCYFSDKRKVHYAFWYF